MEKLKKPNCNVEKLSNPSIVCFRSSLFNNTDQGYFKLKIHINFIFLPIYLIEFDLIVIGGGPGGYVASIKAAQLGLKVIISKL